MSTTKETLPGNLEQRRRPSALRAALLVSLGLHLALALAVAWVRMHTPERFPEEAVAVELLLSPADPVPRRTVLRRPLNPARLDPTDLFVSSTRQEPLVPTAWRPSLSHFPVQTTEPDLSTAAQPDWSLELPAPSLDGTRTTPADAGSSSGNGRSAGRSASPGRRAVGRPVIDSRLDGLRVAASVDLSADWELKTPLELIADSLVAAERTSPKLDVVFVLDISQSMEDNIYAVVRQLDRMAQRLTEQDLDLRIGVVTFHETKLNHLFSNAVDVVQPTTNVAKIRKRLRKVKCSGGEKALNALVVAAQKIRFRPGASRHFVLVTDEYVDGDYSSREVFGLIRKNRIRVDVIGRDEPFQRALPARTGGIWIPIGSLGG